MVFLLFCENVHRFVSVLKIMHKTRGVQSKRYRSPETWEKSVNIEQYFFSEISKKNDHKNSNYQYTFVKRFEHIHEIVYSEHDIVSLSL